MTTANVTFIFLPTTILLFIYVVSSNFQYRRLSIVIIKGYGSKETPLSSFDSTGAIYQAGKDVMGRDTPIMKATT